MNMLKRIDLKGYKSIKETSLELRPLNVLIGANGSGKSNLVSFFKLLNQMMAGSLQRFIATSGGANSLLHYGASVTQQIVARLHFGTPKSDEGLEYRVRLDHAADDALMVLEEEVRMRDGSALDLGGIPARESGLMRYRTPEDVLAKEDEMSRLRKDNEWELGLLRSAIGRIGVFQFHDTSSTAGMRLTGDINENRALRSDGTNLAAVLYRLQQRQLDCYQRIVGTIGQIAPFFADFNLAPSALNPNVIQLRWREREREYDFGAHLLSDGTLRAMALVTLLLQPARDLPSVTVIDEPELGLHPYAIAMLAGLLKSASEHTQIVVASESTTLLDQFEPEDIVVTERCNGETVFNRLNAEELAEWRDEYTLSELWEKNVIGGTPTL